jgi:DNA-binding NtrC family response regulator
MRVLVMDEEEFWREMTHDCLQEEGYRVDTASDYTHLRQALMKCPDVILLGFTVVGSREEELVAYTRKSCPRAIAMVFSTSWPVTQSVERQLLRLGATNVMGRPSYSCDLVKIIEHECSNRTEELASLSSYRRFRLQEAK